MADVFETEAFSDWLARLRDLKAKRRIVNRVSRLAQGFAGVARPVGQGVSELVFDFGPGYRVYYGTRGEDQIVLLGGGDKGSQSRDIEAALALWRAWKESENG